MPRRSDKLNEPPDIKVFIRDARGKYLAQDANGLFVSEDRSAAIVFNYRGEGELGRRTDAAALNVFGPRETEPQFLAVLDKNVRAPEECEMRTSLA